MRWFVSKVTRWRPRISGGAAGGPGRESRGRRAEPGPAARNDADADGVSRFLLTRF